MSEAEAKPGRLRRLRGLVFAGLLITTGLSPLVSLVMAPGTPWEDDDFNGVPNYLDRPEFLVQWAEDDAEIAGTMWNVKAYWIRPSGFGDYNLALTSLGVSQANLYDVTQVGVAELTSLSLPSIIPGLLYWMAGFNLVDATLIPEATPLISHIASSDGKVRFMPVLQYAPDSTYPRMRTSMYLLNGTGPPGALRLDTARVITPDFFTKSDGDDKDDKGILDLLEEIWDFLTGGASLGSLAEVLGKKLLDFAIGEIKKALEEKGWFKKIMKVVKAVAKKLPWLRLVGIVKEILSKLHILDLPWWFPDPHTGLSTHRIDIHLYDAAGNHLLGTDYVNGITTYSGAQGLYFGPWFAHQLMWVSTDMMPYTIEFVSKGPEPVAQYEVFFDDPNPGETKVVHVGGGLNVDEADSGLLYMGVDGKFAVGMAVTSLLVSNFFPAVGETVTVTVTAANENGLPLTDATLTTRTTNGTHTNYYPFTNLGGGTYSVAINLDPSSTHVLADIVTTRPPLLPDEHEFVLVFNLKLLFELDWADYDNNGVINILDIAQAAFVFDQPHNYWDFSLNGIVDILDIALIAFYFDRTFPLPDYPGEGHPAGQVDPSWPGVFCNNLPDPPRTYCQTRV
ncbi:MAG TPA: hypothetical protein VI816_00330 [Candidatus Bathyarchaeia archaeon]|nr:hypothetical protein [Candidatus Bathyarchaeia archaeon]